MTEDEGSEKVRQPLQDYTIFRVVRVNRETGDKAEKFYKLRLGFNELANLEEAVGQDAMTMLMGNGPAFSSLRNIMWVGLADGAPELTKLDVGNIIQDYMREGGDHTMKSLYREIKRAMMAAGFTRLSEDDEKGADDGGPKNVGPEPTTTAH